MPYTGKKQDNFQARCRAAQEGHYLPKLDDLLRCGPYFKSSLKEDIKEFTRLCLNKFSGQIPEYEELRGLLRTIHDDPFMAPYRRAISVIESDNWPLMDHPFGMLVCHRFRYYLASMRDLEQIRWVVLECMDRVAGGWIDAKTNDHMRAALGWALRVRFYDHAAYKNCSQNSIRVDGDTQLFYILTFNRSSDERHS